MMAAGSGQGECFGISRVCGTAHGICRARLRLASKQDTISLPGQRTTVARSMINSHTSRMSDISIRHCDSQDHQSIVGIYNHYIEHSHATFDLYTHSVGERAPWFSQFTDTGPRQLLVAEKDDAILGYCCSTPFKDREAYAVSVETSIYNERTVGDSVNG